jgi:hypothetical protein
MRLIVRAAAALVLVLLVPAAAFAGEHRLGFGYHYWQTLDDIDLDSLGDLDDEGSSALISYQYLPGGLLRFEFDFEYYEDGFGSSGSAYSPQAFVLFGRFFYAGVGVGATKRDDPLIGDDWTDPWYAGRIGLDMLLLPRFHLDLNANYRANAYRDLSDAEFDTMTFGASARFSF